MATTTSQMTVEQFRALPEDSGPFYHELRNGEIIAVTRPKFEHSLIQRRLRRLLEEIAPADSLVDTELAFRALPEYELRVADVAYLSAERFGQTNPKDNIRGAPDIVIEVLSPSNTVAEMHDKERLCLEHGAMQFWIVDPDLRLVKVSTPDGHAVTYQIGQQIPLDLFGARLAVDAIFA